jgi:hypothetical protein
MRDVKRLRTRSECPPVGRNSMPRRVPRKRRHPPSIAFFSRLQLLMRWSFGQVLDGRSQESPPLGTNRRLGLVAQLSTAR